MKLGRLVGWRRGTAAVDDIGNQAAGTPSAEREPPPKAIDLRVLLLCSSHDEPSTQAWVARLDSEGVPFDIIVAGDDLLTSATFEWTAGHGRYVAVILATDSLVRLRNGAYTSSLDALEWVTLRNYLRTYRVRQISAYATPGPTIGLEPASWAGDVGEVPARLTPAGRAVFDDLVGTVPMSPGTYGYQTAVADGADFTTLVAGSQGSPVVGVFVHPDEREEMVVTVASGPFSRHMHLLGHGMLVWATRGRFLGHHGYYLSAQIDDVLLGSNVPPGAAPIRLTPDDVRATVEWSHRRRLRFCFAYNGWGAVRATMSGARDPLTECLIDAAGEFEWINHTFGHLDLGHATSAEISDEIIRNLEWARENGVEVPDDVLITGAHSGLDNPAFMSIADAIGLRWIASDASRAPKVQPFAQGHLVPRHPVNIPLDVCTRDALIHRSGGLPTTGAVDTLTPSDVLAMEASLILTHMLSNDPRPHYAHQNALVGDRLLLGLLDEVLESYHDLISTRPVQLTMANAGRELLRRAAWAELIDRKVVSARVVGGVVEIQNASDQPVEVPWVGAGSRGGWVTITAGETIVLE